MLEKFTVEIISPDSSIIKTDATEVTIPSYEGEMGILKDHIPIISFLKPGIIKVISGSEEHNFYVEDGIVEFKDNTLSILTSSIFDIKDVNKKHVSDEIQDAEKELNKSDLNDQKRFLLNHKVEVLKSLSIN